ncbi:MAG: YrrC family ATP-dependent DNA helicase, partial [Acetobacteraceae bacterium]
MLLDEHQVSESAHQRKTRQGVPEPATEFLAGQVERVTYHNPENGFAVLRIKARGRR